MTMLAGAIDAVLKKIDGHPSATFNEENTAVVLIEPILAALGWDPTDLDTVQRQYKVFDGTRLDYALMLSGKPALFVEVKGLGHSLDNPQFIAQTVNYANNEGVLWCVLTNGVVYRLDKTNEPVPMTDKLMQEVDLREAPDDANRPVVLASMARLSRQSFESGDLEELAELVFVGGKIRTILEGLMTKPTVSFRKSILDQAGGVQPESLDRVLKHFTLVQKAFMPAQGPAKPDAPAAGATPKSAYSVEHHTGGRPKTVVDLFDQLDARLRGLGFVNVSYLKQYINYSTKKKSFVTVQLFRDKLKLYYSVPWLDVPKLLPDAMRDMSTVGHFGMGDAEFILSSQDQLDAAVQLGSVSYKRNGG